MHALFVSLSTDIVLKNPHVYLFLAKEDAVSFAVNALVKVGELNRDDQGFLSEDRQERFIDAEDALRYYQDNLSASEYMHVYNTTSFGDACDTCGRPTPYSREDCPEQIVWCDECAEKEG